MKCIEKSILFFLGILLFFSCQSQRDITGKYTVIQREKYPKIIPSTMYLSLHKDSTFDYLYQVDWPIKKVSSGIWKMDKKGREIILQSFIKNMNDIPITVKEVSNDRDSSLLIILKSPLYKTTRWIVAIDNIEYLIKNDTLLLNKSINIDKFRIIGFSDFRNTFPRPLQDTIQSKTYYVKNSNNNVFHITFPTFVNYDIFYYKPLQDSLKLNRRTLWFEGIRLKKK